MESKRDLIIKIRELLELDNQITSLRQSLNQKSKIRQKLSAELIAVMKQNEITSFDTKTSIIQFKLEKTKPLGKRVLNQLLAEFYKDETDKAEELRTFIAEHTPEKFREKLVRKIKKEAIVAPAPEPAEPLMQTLHEK